MLFRSADGSGEIGGAGGAGREPGFDFDQVRRLTRTIDEHNAAWENWFASVGVRPHPLRYEELTADMAGATQGILDFLGLDLPRGRVIAARHERQGDSLNDQWIDRYRAEAE